MRYLLYFLGISMSFLPSKLIEAIASLLAFVLFDIIRLRRKTVLKNLDIAFKDEFTKERKIVIGRRSIYHFILTCFEFLVSVRTTIDANVEIIGKENIERSLSQGKGVYILCSHIGNWEAMGAAFSNSIVNSYILVKKVGKGSMADFVNDLRKKNNFKSVKRKKKGDGLKAILEILKNNEIVGFVFDQSRPGEPRLPFFGVEAKTNTSLAAIWHKSEAPVVPSYIERISFAKHKLYLLQELDPPQGEGVEKDIVNQSIFYNGVVESMIRACPEQYFWMHKRWK